jgi:hypothetical protein
VGVSAGIADACQGGFSLAPDGGVKQPPVAVSPLLGVPAPADDIEFLTTCSSDTALPEDKAAAALSVVTCSGSHISAPANVGADVVTWSVSSLRAALQDRGLSVNGKKPALLRRLGTALALCSGSKTRIRMGDTRAQVDTLSQGDGVPYLVDLVVPPPSGEASLVVVSSSTLQAVSASPQPTNGCASLGPPDIAGSDVNAVLREPDPPLTSVGAVGGVGLAASIILDTGACASVLGSGRNSGVALGAQCCGASFASPSRSGGEDPAGHLAVSVWADTDDAATACVD